jgi:nicotinate-nucleotide adenylyltransferase
MTSTEAIGIFGGTFDPIHVAHLRAAEEARETLDLDEVRFVPAADPPHKDGEHVTPAPHRLAMLTLALADAPGLRPWGIELERPGPSYSVDTMRTLRATLGEAARLVFLIGRDAFDELHTWKDVETLLGLCDFAVMTRPPHLEPLAAARIPVATRRTLCYDPAIAGFRHESGHRVVPLPITSLDVSASDIRTRVARGRSIRFLVPAAVQAYIERHGLYRPGRPS